MIIKFKKQEVIRSHRLNELTEYYEFLKPTYPHHNEYQKNLNLIHKWSDWLENKKNIPFAVVRRKNEKENIEIVLLVFGKEKKYIKN